LFDSRTRIEGAIVAGLAVQALLRMKGFWFHGAPSVVAALAAVPVLVSGYNHAPRRAKRTVRRTALFALLFLFVMAGVAVIATLQARSKIEKALQQAAAGFDATQNGDRDGAIAQLEGSSSSFREVADMAGSWWAAPIRVVPVAGQQMAAVKSMADEGTALTHVAATGVATIDYEQLRVKGGAIDLNQLRAAQLPVTEAANALDAAKSKLDDVPRDWLLPPLRDKYDEFNAQIDRALPGGRIARSVIAIAPQLLGGDGPKHYIVLFGTPSETRELGGFVGNFAEVQADNGKLSLVRSGRSLDLSDPRNNQGRTLQLGDYLAPYANYRVTEFFGNVSASPNFDDVANITQQLYPQVFGQQVDGVFYMDPYALAALLDLTGPVNLKDANIRLNQKNAAQTLLKDQYVNFDSHKGRVDFLDEATRQTFERLTSGDLPKPSTVASAMNPMVQQGHMVAFSANPAFQAVFQQLGLGGQFPSRGQGDFLEVTQSNQGQNKIDAYLQRNVTYAASFRPDSGEVDSTATIQLVNSAPADGLPDIVIGNAANLPKGTNDLFLTVYSPLTAQSATIDGKATGVNSAPRFGVTAYTIPVQVPPGATVTVELHLKGQIARGRDYQLTIGRQPVVNTDKIEVHVQGTSGWKVQPSPGFDVAAGEGAATVDVNRVDVLTARLDK